MAELTEAASELEKLIRDCEFENQQYVKQIEKEKQLIEALERETEWKTEETKRLQDSISQLDNDTKQYHKQFTINRDNCESLKKTGQVLTEHSAAMNSKLELAITRNKQEEEEHNRLLEHYRSMWNNYKAKYESWAHVKKLREQQAKEQVIRSRVDARKALLDELMAKVRGSDEKAIWIKVAESYERREKKLKEAAIKMQGIERMNRDKDDQLQREAIQENTMDHLNHQLKESHIEDKERYQDEMETNQLAQQDDTEEPASPMISVFSRRSDAEEDMQTGDLQSVAVENQEDILPNQDQQIRKPQSWLENYQEQNQKQSSRPSEPAPADQINLQQEQIHQKPQTHQDQLQPPFVAYHNVGQQQGSEEMEASVSIHLPSRSEEKLGNSSPPHPEEHTPSKSRPTTHLIPTASQSAVQQSSMSFNNPAFQTSPNPPQFTVPILQTKPIGDMPGNIQISRRPPPKPQLVSTRPTLIRPPVQSSSTNQAPIRAPRPIIPSSRIPAVSMPHQRTATPPVQSNVRLPQNMVRIPQRPQSTGPAPRVQIPLMRPIVPQSNVSRPVASQAQPFLIRPPVPIMPQAHKPATNQSQQHRTQPQLQQNKVAQQNRAQPQAPAFSTPSFTAVPISQPPKQSPGSQPLPRTQISSASPMAGFVANQLQGLSMQVPSPSKSQSHGQREVTQPSPQQTVSPSVSQKSEAPRRGQGYEGHQVMAGQPSDNQMETAGAKTPESSPVPMHTSPYTQSNSTENGDAVHTPEHQKKGSEGKTESPFNMEKHKQRVKHIKNKSPGQPLVYAAGRRMFNGGKGDNADQDKLAGFSKIFDKSASFLVFGGGDGLQVPPFGKSGEDSTGFSNGTLNEKQNETSFLQKSTKDGKAVNNSEDSGFFNFDSYKIGPSDKETTDSGFSFDFGKEQKESQFNFDFDSFGKDKDDSGFSFDFGKEAKESQFNFDFDSFGKKAATEPGKTGSPAFSFDFGPEPSFNFESPNMASEGDGVDKAFSFNFSAESSTSGADTAQTFSLF